MLLLIFLLLSSHAIVFLAVTNTSLSPSTQFMIVLRVDVVTFITGEVVVSERFGKETLQLPAKLLISTILRDGKKHLAALSMWLSVSQFKLLQS